MCFFSSTVVLLFAVSPDLKVKDISYTSIPRRSSSPTLIDELCYVKAQFSIFEQRQDLRLYVPTPDLYIKACSIVSTPPVLQNFSYVYAKSCHCKVPMIIPYSIYTSSHLIADQFSNVISSVRPAQYTWMSDHVHLETAGIISYLSCCKKGCHCKVTSAYDHTTMSLNTPVLV